MKLLGKKVIITDGKDKGSEGYVKYECEHAITVEAPDLVGVDSWYGFWYVRKENVKVMA